MAMKHAGRFVEIAFTACKQTQTSSYSSNAKTACIAIRSRAEKLREKCVIKETLLRCVSQQYRNVQYQLCYDMVRRCIAQYCRSGEQWPQLSCYAATFRVLVARAVASVHMYNVTPYQQEHIVCRAQAFASFDARIGRLAQELEERKTTMGRVKCVVSYRTIAQFIKVVVPLQSNAKYFIRRRAPLLSTLVTSPAKVFRTVLRTDLPATDACCSCAIFFSFLLFHNVLIVTCTFRFKQLTQPLLIRT